MMRPFKGNYLNFSFPFCYSFACCRRTTSDCKNRHRERLISGVTQKSLEKEKKNREVPFPFLLTVYCRLLHYCYVTIFTIDLKLKQHLMLHIC